MTATPQPPSATPATLAVSPLVLGLGMQELLVLLLILILLFGASKLPQIGRGMGEGIRNFKKGMKGDEGEREIEDGVKDGSVKPK